MTRKAFGPTCVWSNERVELNPNPCTNSAAQPIADATQVSEGRARPPGADARQAVLLITRCAPRHPSCRKRRAASTVRERTSSLAKIRDRFASTVLTLK